MELNSDRFLLACPEGMLGNAGWSKKQAVLGKGIGLFSFLHLVSSQEALRGSKMPSESIRNELRDSGPRRDCSFSFVLSDKINYMLVS